MARLVVLIVLGLVVAGGLAAAQAAQVDRHHEYTPEQAYDAGILTKAALAEQFGCQPLLPSNGRIICLPGDLPLCPTRLGVPAFTTRSPFSPMPDNRWECAVSPYDLRLITDFSSGGPPKIPHPYLRGG